MIPRGHAEWLETVERLPESDLPCNVSTVAFAIKVAAEYRTDAENWRALYIEQIDADEQQVIQFFDLAGDSDV